MHNDMINIIELHEMEVYRNNIIHLINYCWKLEHQLGEKKHTHYDDINNGTNGFENLRILIDSANATLMTINAIMFEIQSKN